MSIIVDDYRTGDIQIYLDVGELTIDGISTLTEPNGDLIINDISITSIPENSLRGRSGITSITSKSITSIGSSALRDCTGLINLNCSKLTTLAANSLQGCTNLTNLNVSNLTSMNTSSCHGCSKLESFIAPKLSYLYNYNTIFYGCTKLSIVYLPKVNVMYGNGIFQLCTSLEYLVLPSFGNSTNASQQQQAIFASNNFHSCTSFKGLDCYTIFRIDNAAFENASSFDTLIIRNKCKGGTALTTLNNIAAFKGTPFADGGSGGTLYVPEDQISGYQSASNWSTILGYANNSIKKIEGTTYETHYVDGTLI